MFDIKEFVVFNPAHPVESVCGIVYTAFLSQFCHSLTHLLE